MRPDAEPRRRLSSWTALVAVSACVVGGCLLVLGVWWAASREEQVTSYAVRGSLNAVTLDLGDADARIVGGGERIGVSVRRIERFAFGRQAASARDVSGGVLRIRSRCPTTVMGSCSASYRLTVPDNVPVTVRTSAGNVRVDGYRGSARIDTRGGNITVGEFCGFALQARAEAGNVLASASCAPERFELRSATGNVRAVVPTGRYRVDAVSDAGHRRVTGLVPAEDAPFQIQALSSRGDVAVEALP